MKNKQTKNGMMKGAMILGAGVFISRLLGMIYRIPLTNTLGDKGNGLYSAAFQVYMVLITLSATSVPSAISKLVAERTAVGAYKDAHRVYKIALLYSFIVSIFLATIMWVGADWIAVTIFNTKELILPMKALAPTVVIVTIIAVMRGYFQGMNQMMPTAISQIIEQIFNAVFSVVLAWYFLKYGIEVAVAGSTTGTGIGALAGFVVLLFIYLTTWPRLHKKIKNSEPYTYQSKRTILKQILITMVPIMISTSVFSIMVLIDQSMIANKLPMSIEYLRQHEMLSLVPVADAKMQTNSDIVVSLLGQFSIKYSTLLNVPISLILQLGAAAIPAIAGAMAVKDYKDVRKKIRLVFKTGMLIGAPAAVGLILFADPIIALLFQGAPEGGKLLSYGAIGLIFVVFAQLSAGILQGMGKQKIPTRNAIIACSVKVMINMIVLKIPVLHIYGVIHSTTLCYLIYAVLNIKYLCKEVNLKFNWKKIVIRPTISAIIMGVLSFGIYYGILQVIENQKIVILIVIPIAAVIYLLVGLATGTITKKDLSSIPGGNKFIRLFS